MFVAGLHLLLYKRVLYRLFVDGEQRLLETFFFECFVAIICELFLIGVALEWFIKWRETRKSK